METVPDGAATGMGLLAFMLILIAWTLVIVVPFWKIWKRTGHSGAWGILAMLPAVNFIALWVLAFKEWPALRDRDRQ